MRRGTIDKNTKSFIYFLYAEHANAIKIGMSRNLHARMKRIRAVAPEPLILLKVIVGHKIDELALHKKFQHLRLPHGEWFTLAPDLLDFIDAQDGVDI